jgi:hypothetical protein
VQQLAADFADPVNETVHARVVQHSIDHGPERREGSTLTIGRHAGLFQIGINASMVSGVSDAGLSTTGQLAARADLAVAIAAGKFHGVTSTATPVGLWYKDAPPMMAHGHSCRDCARPPLRTSEEFRRVSLRRASPTAPCHSRW